MDRRAVAAEHERALTLRGLPARSKIRAVPPLLVVSTRVPSGEKRASVSRPVWPESSIRTTPVSVSRTVAPRSWSWTTRRLPSAEKLTMSSRVP